MGENSKIVETPLMRQYFKVKAEHPDALLLFRVGDFYETFGKNMVSLSYVARDEQCVFVSPETYDVCFIVAPVRGFRIMLWTIICLNW